MKQLDFEHGTVTGNILGAAVPMLVAQILNLLYNIVDRIYIARIPKVGTAALGAVGLCFPLIVIITAFSNLYGSGGAPLFSIHRGKKETQAANDIMNTSFSMLCLTGVILMVVGMLLIRPILILFGASEGALAYACPYMMLYLIGTLPSMIAVGMNPFINAQGYSLTGMLSGCDRCGGQPGSGSAVYLCSELWCARSSNRNGYFPVFVSGLCTAFSFRKSGAEGALPAQDGTCRIRQLRERDRQSRYGGFYHAAD